jgi:hypothetical protein
MQFEIQSSITFLLRMHRTDASDVAIVGTLIQMDSADKELKPLGFYSHKLTKSAIKYRTSKHEKLEMTWCLEQVRQLALGWNYQLNIITDHKPLLKVNGLS